MLQANCAPLSLVISHTNLHFYEASTCLAPISFKFNLQTLKFVMFLIHFIEQQQQTNKQANEQTVNRSICYFRKHMTISAVFWPSSQS